MCLNQKGLSAYLLKLQLQRWPRGEPEKEKVKELTNHENSGEIKSAATATVLQFLKPAQTSGQKYQTLSEMPPTKTLPGHLEGMLLG